jgi:hypothetical protein
MKAFANSLTKSRNMLEVKNREEEGWMIGMEIEYTFVGQILSTKIVYRWSDDVK